MATLTEVIRQARKLEILTYAEELYVWTLETAEARRFIGDIIRNQITVFSALRDDLQGKATPEAEGTRAGYFDRISELSELAESNREDIPGCYAVAAFSADGSKIVVGRTTYASGARAACTTLRRVEKYLPPSCKVYAYDVNSNARNIIAQLLRKKGISGKVGKQLLMRVENGNQTFTYEIVASADNLTRVKCTVKIHPRMVVMQVQARWKGSKGARTAAGTASMQACASDPA